MNGATWHGTKTNPKKRGASPKIQRSARISRPYPRTPLSKAIEVIQKIKELNGGNPWPPKDVADAVGIAPRSTNFQYLISAARDYGLIEGNSRADDISLTTLGRDIVYAPNSAAEIQKKREAFFKIQVFKEVFDHYQGNRLPDTKYLGNTLQRSFQLPPEIHDEFASLFRENCSYLGYVVGQEDTAIPGESAQHSEIGVTPTVIVGAPKGNLTVQHKAFVIMPFVEKSERRPNGFFSEVLRALITPAATEVGFLVETANRQGSDVIQSTIINELLDADLVIADLTDHNPNVLFELGLRMSEKRKPVALIKSKDTGRLFDVDNMMRVYEYNPVLWPSTLQHDLPELTAHIRATWDGRAANRSYLDILRGGASTSA